MNDIDELLTRGVDKIYPSKDELEKVLKSGKKLRLYQGFDPTGDKLHVGHMVGLRKLAQWQKMGHNVIFLIGDGTGQAGDPSGKTSARDRFMTRDELRDNAKDYVLQAGKIIDFDAPNVEILYNSDWLNKLSLVDVLDLMKHFSLGQLSERDLFVERKKKGEEVNLREAFYPVLQAYDSVAMNVDLEIGGTDQTFNMLAGRKLVREMKGKDKFVMTTPLLTDSKGNKIGKTEGNIIALTDEPFELYRKIMAQGDDIIVKGLEYLTDIPMEEIKNTEDQLEKGGNPIEFKKTLAFEVTKQLNSEADAKKAQAEFERVVQKGEAPRDLLEIEIKEDIKIDEDLLVKHGLANSKSDAKRLFEQNAVRKDGKKISSGTKAENGILNVGRKVVKLKLL
ncbi:MAG: Tyrosyl-tRNA synthetase [Candidatus Levybacteria bacterium GW2011_GWA2_40_8]|nr:MAG: Tyrosyl-tRNA synthetase [Candidatus Levybacteria bacterium GW2011_GWA2_40_8]